MTFFSSGVIGRAALPAVAVAVAVVAMRLSPFVPGVGTCPAFLEGGLTAPLRQTNAGLRQTEPALTNSGETRSPAFAMREMRVAQPRAGRTRADVGWAAASHVPANHGSPSR